MSFDPDSEDRWSDDSHRGECRSCGGPIRGPFGLRTSMGFAECETCHSIPEAPRRQITPEEFEAQRAAMAVKNPALAEAWAVWYAENPEQWTKPTGEKVERPTYLEIPVEQSFPRQMSLYPPIRLTPEEILAYREQGEAFDAQQAKGEAIPEPEIEEAEREVLYRK